MAAEMGLEEGVNGFIGILIDDSISIFEAARESELLEWARGIREQFNHEEIQVSIAFGLDRWRRRLQRTSNPRVEDLGDPLPYQLLTLEFSALFNRAKRKTETDAYGPLDHSLDVGEVALASLKDALGWHPAGRAFVSLLLELVKLAKAIGKRISSGF